MKSIKYILLLAGGLLSLSSCNDYLDMEPLDQVTPDTYLWAEDDLAAYALKQYSFTTPGVDDGVGIFKGDNATDNQASAGYDTKWIPGQWRVADHYDYDYNDPWYFSAIYNCNYFLETVLPRYEAGTLTGTPENIKHYIGEVYLLRAWAYFDKLQTFGDFPIIEKVLPDEENALVEASKRQPRHLVARFILSDLDHAIGLMSDAPKGGTNRLSKNVAYLIKSRVALYEASWETYHANTAMVPNGPGNPAPKCTYDAQTEIKFFLSECKTAAAVVADQVKLAENLHVWADGSAKMNNPYYAQFADENLSSYPEILFWRDYDASLGIKHSTGYYLRLGGNTGYTRQYVESFLMKNGLPTYADNSGYKGDLTMDNVRADRDERLQLFMLKPGEILTTGQVDFEDKAPLLPNILGQTEKRCVTGYQVRKGLSNSWVRDYSNSVEGCPIFRGVEAYLNYIEASCMESGGNSIDAKAQGYWKQVRERAGLKGDYMITVNATDLSKESDWAVYSAGEQVSPLLFNIRRERRCELIAEGMRMYDLKRWRALDQVKNWQPQGVNLWESKLCDQYVDSKGNSQLVADGTDNSNVSSPSLGTYLHPYEIVNKTTNLLYGKGYNWCEAHYLSPIAVKHFRLTASNPNDLSTSVMYQNPGWSTVADEGPVIK